MEIVVNQKTGFVNLTPGIPIIILDSRGVKFYDTTDLKKPVKMFNLPTGKYNLVSGKINKLKNPVDYRLPELPKPERFIQPPFDFKLSFGHNPNKCTIFWNRKEILFDSDLANAPEPELYFILFHEYGHSLFHTEKYADLVAARLMLRRGFNPSQIGSSHIDALSSYQFDRKKYIVKRILKR